jgi:hypothetical protein
MSDSIPLGRKEEEDQQQDGQDPSCLQVPRPLTVSHQGVPVACESGRAVESTVCGMSIGFFVRVVRIIPGW